MMEQFHLTSPLSGPLLLENKADINLGECGTLTLDCCIWLGGEGGGRLPIEESLPERGTFCRLQVS